MDIYYKPQDIKGLNTKQKQNRNSVLPEKKESSHEKYRAAVELYSNTDMPLKDIAEKCGVSYGALGIYLRRYWRELVLRRHKIIAEGVDPKSIKIIHSGQQSPTAHEKYKNAILACDSLKYISLNISQIARMYNLNGTALANFMRIHYEDILVNREKMREKLGYSENVKRGARKECLEQYAKAIDLYKSTNITLPEIAKMLNISESGLSQHLRFYHKDVLALKRNDRLHAQHERKKSKGALTGNGRRNEPRPDTEQKYAKALALYRDTSMTMKDIIIKTGVPKEGFRYYLHKWHRELVLEHSGITENISDDADLRKERKKMKATAAKYADAIDCLKNNQYSVAKVSHMFGLNAEVFRQYLHKHEPEIARQTGMTCNAEGKTTLYRSQEKYKEAIHLYETTSESLRTISEKLSLKYISLYGYIRRNYPKLATKHLEHVEKERNNVSELFDNK